jgi:hypothetical protein
MTTEEQIENLNKCVTELQGQVRRLKAGQVAGCAVWFAIYVLWMHMRHAAAGH